MDFSEENKQVDVDDKSNFEHEGNYKGRNVKKKSEANEYSSTYSQPLNQFELENNEWFFEKPNHYFDEPFFLNNQEDLFHIDTDQIQLFFESKTAGSNEQLEKYV